MHRKKVMAGLFLAAGLSLTLLTPRLVRAEDALPGSAVSRAEDVLPGCAAIQAEETFLVDGDGICRLTTPEDLSVSISPGSLMTPEEGDGSGEDADSGESSEIIPAESIDSEAADNLGEESVPAKSDGSEEPGELAEPTDTEELGELAEPTEPTDPADAGELTEPTESAAEDQPSAPDTTPKPDIPPAADETKQTNQTDETNQTNKTTSQTTSDTSSAPADPAISQSLIPAAPAPYSSERGKYVARFVKVAKVYAIPKGNAPVTVREDKSARSRAVGTIGRDGLAFILADKDDSWIYIESGEVRGFVPRHRFETGDDVTRLVREKGELSFSEAKALVDPADNKAYSYTKTTTRDSRGFLTGLRAAIIEKAEEYLGGPYVWGGTSLTEGCDCSGFIQSLFGLFGIDLPRTSREQAEAGHKIAVSEIEPGDLVFYETDGVVSHVMMAIGGGRAINAANARAGIIISDIDKDRAVRACRVLEAGDELTAAAGGADLTAAADGAVYTQDQMELIWAIVAQEDDTCYDGALAVISCAMNRADRNYGGYGTTALDQLTADGQFCYSPKISDPSYWMSRLGGRVPAYVKAAVSDCLTQGIRNNGYLNFRSGNRNGISVRIGGNWFF